MQKEMRCRGFVVGLMSFGLLLGVAMAPQSIQAATSNGPYYAMPSWDQKLPVAMRFVVLIDWNSEAVLDRETGLVWERSPELGEGHFWHQALFNCANRTTGGRKGWRLPSMFELASLVDPSVAHPSLPAGHPFTNVQSNFYWSATTYAVLPADAWFVSFSAGGLNHENKGSVYPYWCVRGPMNADAY